MGLYISTIFVTIIDQAKKLLLVDINSPIYAIEFFYDQHIFFIGNFNSTGQPLNY